MSLILDMLAGVKAFDTGIDGGEVGQSRSLVVSIASLDQCAQHHSERENMSFEAPFIHRPILAASAGESIPS